MVARCTVHEVAFTVYPPGHYPYGRHALAPCHPDGDDKKHHAWEETVFEAAVAAADGEPWVRVSQAKNGENQWWSTQGRHLDLAMALTGTHPALPDGLRHRIAETLRVPALVLIQEASKVRAAPGFVSRGHAVAEVLERLLRGGVIRRLLVVGELLGLWGRPLWWDAGVLRPVAAFSASGTDPPGL